MVFDLLSFVNKILLWGTVVSQVYIVLLVVFTLLLKKKIGTLNFIAKNSLKFAFLVAFIAMAGSLFYSTYAGFTPCVLCWFQRIFMYPEVIILGLALLKKDSSIIDYSLALSLIGLVISIYHNYIYFNAIQSTVCTSAESCTTPYVLGLGYITIPMMALTAFSLISLLLILNKKYVSK